MYLNSLSGIDTQARPVKSQNVFGNLLGHDELDPNSKRLSASSKSAQESVMCGECAYLARARRVVRNGLAKWMRGIVGEALFFNTTRDAAWAIVGEADIIRALRRWI